MITWLEQFLVRYPELALFLVIAGVTGSEALRLVRSALARSRGLFSLAYWSGTSHAYPSPA
jgi:hypothetical protein